MTLEHMITALSEEIMTKIPHLTERWIIVNAGFIHNGFSLLLMQFCYCFSFCLLILLWKNIKVHHVRSVFVLKGHSVKMYLFGIENSVCLEKSNVLCSLFFFFFFKRYILGQFQNLYVKTNNYKCLIINVPQTA